MRSYHDMLELIFETAEKDERIRAVTLEGSGAGLQKNRDSFSDFDLTFFVRELSSFTQNRNYMEKFGDILIQQCPDDWYNHPYDDNMGKKFTYLTQYEDGNRIDLTFMDISRISDQKTFVEPRTVLLNKDHYTELKDQSSEEIYFIQKPDQFEYECTCNEFLWLSNYVTKGLCRRQLYYAKHILDVDMMQMFIKMLSWSIGVRFGFELTLGVHEKYLKNYLKEEEMTRFSSVFSNGEYEDIWIKLFNLYDYFTDLSAEVSESLGFSINPEQIFRVRKFMEARKNFSVSDY